MVIEDIHSQLCQKNQQQSQHRASDLHLADPMDRAAAFIIDIFIILLPLLMLSTAPFKRNIFSAVLLDNNLSFVISIFLGALSTIVVITIYNFISIWLFGATFGKRFVGIRVIDVWSKNKPRFSVSFLRAITWWVGLLSFGFSFASIFTNTRRRALHDRISETMVVSDKYKAIQKPSVYESSIVKGIFAGFIAFISVIIVVIILDLQRDLSKSNEVTAMLEEKGGLCGSVGKAYREWPVEIKSTTPRLEVAMALFSAGIISESCLEGEASFVFRQDIESPMAYLAKAFVYSDRSKLSDSYLQRVCELAKDSKECFMSEIVAQWDKEDWGDVNNKFLSINADWPIYIQIWAVRNAINQGDFLFAKKILDSLPNVDSLKNFKINFKTKSFVADFDRAHLNNLTDLALSSLDENEKLNLSTWLCYQQISLNCETLNTKSCDYFNRNFDHNLLVNDLFALTAMRKESCNGKVLENLSNTNRDIQKLNQALKVTLLNRKKGADMLWAIYTNKNQKLKIREEAARYFIDITDSNEALEKLIILWKARPQELEWQKTGYRLFTKLNKLNFFDKAIEVGESVQFRFKDNLEFSKNFALALYRAGKNHEAWKIISKNSVIESNSTRAPANADEYEFMIQSLKREFIK